MELEELIGQTIVQRRKELGLSQEILAKKSGVDRRYLSDLEHGTRSVSVRVLKNIAVQLDWTLTKLIATSEEKETSELEPEMCEKHTLAYKIGQTISRLRISQNLSDILFCKITGLNQDQLRLIESGELGASLYDLEKIAIALRMTISELLIEAEKVQ